MFVLPVNAAKKLIDFQAENASKYIFEKTQYLSQNHSEPVNKLNKKASTNVILPSGTGIATDYSRLWEIFIISDLFFYSKKTLELTIWSKINQSLC